MRSLGHPLQYACFSCRKCFKRPQMSGSNSRFMTGEQRLAQLREAQRLNVERLYVCPNCGGACHFMGLDFKAPKITDIKAWRRAEDFIRSGRVFYRGQTQVDKRIGPARRGVLQSEVKEETAAGRRGT